MQPGSEQHSSLQYRKKALPFHLVRKLRALQLHRIYNLFASKFPPRPQIRVLDLGVSAADPRREYFFFEVLYPYPSQIVAAGVDSRGRFGEFFPEISYVQVSRDEPLPFPDGAFDVVFCNAVLEHVGSRDRQRKFLEEIIRVGRSCFVTTPNRWYPVEFHTMLPIIHLLPTPLYRRIFRFLGFDFFSREENLNLLDRKALAALVPPELNHELATLSFLGLPANLVLIVNADINGSRSVPFLLRPRKS